MNTIELQNPKVLIRPHQPEKAKGKNVIIGEEKQKEEVHEKLLEKVPQETSALGGQGGSKGAGSALVGLTGQGAGLTGPSRDKKAKKDLKKKVRLTFQDLLEKYEKKEASQK